MTAVDVLVEAGKKRAFAAALDWPGWTRSGRDEDSALQALVDYGPRYAAAIGPGARAFKAPTQVSRLNVVERLQGDASTDYGVQHLPASSDSRPIEQAELDRLSARLEACWRAFDTAARAAASATLRTGPRGGGRELQGIQGHVLDADAAYLGQLGGKFASSGRGSAADLKMVRKAFLETLAAGLRGELPTTGPRGGLRWSPRYAIRRSAWHSLDHAWEIEDRAEP